MLADVAPVGPEDEPRVSLPVWVLALPASERAADEPPVLAAPCVPARQKVSHSPATQADWQVARVELHFGWARLALPARAAQEHG